MALWKAFRGKHADLDNVEKHDGYVYFCTDDATLFFDYTDTNGNLIRKQISAKDAETLSGLTLDEIKQSINWNDIIDKPTFGSLAEKDEVTRIDLAQDVQQSLAKADSALQSYTETDPTVPAWAKEASKPSYTASEVGALPVSGGGTVTSSNIDVITVKRTDASGGGAAIGFANIDGMLGYIGMNTQSEELRRLKKDKSSWVTMIDAGNINSYAMPNYSIEIYNGTGGSPKPVKFASFNYSTCGSDHGIAAKISLVSGHGNGTHYAFLEDAIIKVNYLGTVNVDNFKYYGIPVSDNGVQRQYGDIFWVIDTTNKIVDFYVLMGQYSYIYQTPWKRLTYSTGGTVTQYTSCTIYSSGDKNWANNSEFALMSDVTSALNSIPTPDVSGQIDTHNTASDAHSDIRSTVNSLASEVAALKSSVVTVYAGSADAMTADVGSDGDIYWVTD